LDGPAIAGDQGF